MPGRVGGIKLQDQIVSNGLTVPFANMHASPDQMYWPLFCGRWVTKLAKWVAKFKLIALLLATAALWVRFRTSLKDTKWAT
jgi:hypothetical protein